MQSKQHFNLFDLIAEPYGWFYAFQKKHYKVLVQAMALNPDSTVLDLGAGTGAMASLLSEEHDVLAVDGSRAMLRVMKRLDPSLKVELVDITDKLPYTDQQFDVVLTSFVLHGLHTQERIHVLNEMKRVGKSVIVYDYHGKRHLFTDIVEYIEQGDYFNFMQQFKAEFSSVFPEHTIIPIKSGSALYRGGFDEDTFITQ